MASFEGVLANIPGYGGYLAKDQLNRRNTLSDIQQIQGVQGLMAQMQAFEQQKAVRELMADPTIGAEEKRMKLLQFAKDPAQAATIMHQMATERSTNDLRTAQNAREQRMLEIANQNAAREQRKVAASQQLADLQRTGGVGPLPSGIAPEVMFDEEAAIRAAREKQARGERVSIAVPDAGEMRALASIIDPAAGAKAALEGAKPDKLKDLVTPVAQGYVTRGPDGKLQYVKTYEQPPQQPRNLQLVPGRDGHLIVDPNGRARPLLDQNDKPVPPPRDTEKNAKLPPASLKLQAEELDAIGAASGLNADLGAIEKQIKEKKLDLGFLSNKVNSARNELGITTPQSINFSSFQATLERLRNESLRLNKGVQTEGDSVRAWNELMKNINDNELVKQRITEIRKLNERAVSLRKMNIDVIRGNYGLPPLDTNSYENLPASLGVNKQEPNSSSRSAPQSASPQKAIRITGDAEYNLLPKGSRYVGPDGVEREKP